MLSGYKTYIVGALTVVWAIVGYALGKIELATMIETASMGLGMITLRHGVSSLK